MPSITTLIGNRFEQILKADFPEWKKVDDSEREIEPDFDAGDFRVESKTGYFKYNMTPKLYQIRSFKTNGKPVVYCIGFHDFERAMTKLKGKSKRRASRILTRHMNAIDAYFVSQEVIANMFERESRWNKKETRFYCGLKRRTFEQIIDNVPVERDGQIVLPCNYYGIRREDFVFSAPKIKISNFPYGYIMNQRDCDLVLPILEKKRKN